MLKSISFVLLLCLPVVAIAQTDDVTDSSVQKQNLHVTIYLKDGGVLEGKITDSDETTITIQPYLGGQITISRSYIKEIKVFPKRQITAKTEKTNEVKKANEVEKTNQVFDDDGNVITEAEIQANMGMFFEFGCCIGGGCLGLIPATFLLVWICDVGLDGEECANENLGPIAFLGTIIVAGAASYYIGKKCDRQRAIERIKTQRRKQKENAFGEQDTTDGFYFQLLKVRF